jgi:hypothetical protein
MDEIESLPLHDALMKFIRLEWSEAVLEIDLLVFTEREKSAQPHSLRFTGVYNFQAPHECPWGESNSINGVKRTVKGCEIEMQSGDVLIIEARSYKFEPRNL